MTEILPVQLNHVVIDAVGRFNETQELGIWACAGCGRYGQKKPAERGNRNIARVACHRHRATAAIDDCRIKNAAAFNPQRITLRRPNLRSGRPVADVIHLVLVDAISTDRGGAGATRRRKTTPWSSRMSHTPIAGAVPDPVPDRDGLGRNLGLITVFAGERHVLVKWECRCMSVSNWPIRSRRLCVAPVDIS